MSQLNEIKIFEKLPVTAFIKDGDGRYLWVNKHWCDVCQIKPEEVLGKNDRELSGFQSQDVEEWMAHDKQVLSSGQATTFNEAVHYSNGQVLESNCCKFPIDFNGKKCLMGIAVP